MNERIAIIGDEDFFAGFSALGIEIRDLSKEGRQADEVLSSLDPVHYAIVFVAEQYAPDMWDIISERNKNTPQTVIVIPGGQEATGIAGMKIRQLVRRAVGADIG